MPLEPIMELVSHCCPHLAFSLFSTGRGEGNNNSSRNVENIIEEATAPETDPGHYHGMAATDRVYGGDP
jgi:hypothetical protein